ncbi:MAG TPA: hypothetical protein VGD81_01120 [Opitutaceae bacterium]
MNPTLRLLRFAAALAFVPGASALFAAKPIAGPKGGRVLTASAPHAEFFVEKDRTVAVTFYDAGLKPLAPEARVVSAIAEAPSGKVRLEFEKTASGFVSREPLPDGDGYTIVVQIREEAGAKPRNYRVVFHDEICDECQRAEYACVCEGEGHEGGGHAH